MRSSIYSLALVLLALLSTDVTRGQDTVSSSVASNSLDTLEKLGKLIDRDWQDRPEWADMAASLLKGERMGNGLGWWKESLRRHDWSWLQEKFDLDKNGSVDQQELSSDEIFSRLDRNLDKQLTPEEFDWSEPPRSKESEMASTLFYRWDTDSNGKITQEELLKFFQQADGEQAGYVTPADLAVALRPPVDSSQPEGDEKPAYRPGVDRMRDLELMLRGDFGSLESGPELNDEAPDFELPLQGQSETVKLSDLRGKPVVLIFGSFT